MCHGKSGAVLILCVQIVFVILFGIFARYDYKALPESVKKTEDDKKKEDKETNFYAMFMDTHVMIFVGFGYLMTFMKRYVFGGVGFNFLVAAMILEWALLSNGFYHLNREHKIPISLKSIITADFAAAVVLISMGAVLGRTTYVQLLIMGIIEIALYSANNYLAETTWIVSDCGGSMFVHAFGAYFGLAVSFVLNIRSHKEDRDFESSYTSDAFAMIGTLFLWMFWPSFNAAEVIGDSQQRAVINTYISMAACCVTAFVFSYILSKERKFDMVHIQNSTWSGGVAIGATADLMVQPWGAALIGTCTGYLSVFGFTILTPWMASKLGIPDTCGVHNLHGFPGVLAGLISVLMAALASKELYHDTLYVHYQAMAPKESSGLGRSATQQALYQLAALAVTLVIAIAGGLITGLILKSKCWNKDPQVQLNKDDDFWEIQPEAKT